MNAPVPMLQAVYRWEQRNEEGRLVDSVAVILSFPLDVLPPESIDVQVPRIEADRRTWRTCRFMQYDTAEANPS